MVNKNDRNNDDYCLSICMFVVKAGSKVVFCARGGELTPLTINSFSPLFSCLALK